MSYRITLPDDLPEHLRPASGAHDPFFTAAREAGLSEEQVQSLLTWYYKRASTLDTDHAERWGAMRRESEQALRAQWGDDYDENVALGRRTARSLLGDQAESLLELALHDGKPLGDHPAVVEGLARLGRALDESQPAGAGGRSAADPADDPARSRIRALRALQDTDPVRYRSDGVQAALRAAYEEAYVTGDER